MVEHAVRMVSQIALEMSKLCQLFFHRIVQREYDRRLNQRKAPCELPDEIKQSLFVQAASFVSTMNPAQTAPTADDVKDIVDIDALTDQKYKPDKMVDGKLVNGYPSYWEDLHWAAWHYHYLRIESGCSLPLASRENMAPLLEELAKQTLTNFKNHVTTNFKRRTIRYLRHVFRPIPRNNRDKCVFVVYDALVDGSDRLAVPRRLKIERNHLMLMRSEFATMRRVIGADQLPVTKYGMEKSWWFYLPWFYHIMAKNDQHNAILERRRQAVSVSETKHDTKMDQKDDVSSKRKRSGRRPKPEDVLEKSFTLVPDRSPGPVSIAITSTTLNRGLLPMIGRARAEGDDSKSWTYFDFSKLHVPKNSIDRHFAQRIMTDGVRCSVMFKRPLAPAMRVVVTQSNDQKTQVNHPVSNKSELPKRKKVEKSYGMAGSAGVRPPSSKSRVIGLDPGGKDLFTAVDASDGRIIKTSTAEYYNIAGFTRAKRKQDARLKRAGDVQIIETETPSLKSASFAQVERHVSHVLRHLRRLMEYHMARWHRKLARRRVRGKQKALHTLCTRIAGRKQAERQSTAVGFGDGMFGLLPFKGHAKGPVKTLFKQLNRYCHVDAVCEYKTSQLCHKCGGQLEPKIRSERECDRQSRGIPVPDEGRLVPGRSIHGVRICQSESCRYLHNKKPVALHHNRDVNAARNILWLYKNGTTFHDEDAPRKMAKSCPKEFTSTSCKYASRCRQRMGRAPFSALGR